MAGDGIIVGGGVEVLLGIVCRVNDDGVPSFDFVEDVGGEFFEACGGESSQFLTCLVPFWVEIIFWYKEGLISFY